MSWTVILTASAQRDLVRWQVLAQLISRPLICLRGHPSREAARTGSGRLRQSRPEWPYLERYGYTWIQHPDGLYYGPPYPGTDDHLVWLEERGMLGHSSVRLGEHRYFLRFPEADDT